MSGEEFGELAAIVKLVAEKPIHLADYDLVSICAFCGVRKPTALEQHDAQSCAYRRAVEYRRRYTDE